MDNEQILAMVTTILVNEFEIDQGDIVPSTNIYEDLDIDSIDVVDLVVRLRAETGRSIEPENFKQVRTIADLIDVLHKLINQ
ncbi:acyl carrier protein [Paraglaciecola hydrolytica]|uniref:Acyl carrier protein n=1 Tax=Paraglaciecola hydrolytica TaxID=1799789 RepID=A0A136A258_9ALTE|nr:acyl carrier protein [Paraglaciecola hydrolytica]KXI29329.1 acyl carrier protein [Paraglaciecola hydrolytica]